MRVNCKCNLLKVSSEPLRTCLEGDNDISNAPQSTARCTKHLSGETSSILRLESEIACREGISDPSSVSLAVTKTKEISCDAASHVTVRNNC